MKVYIETDRFLMRTIEDSDVDGIFQLDSDPEVHKYLGNHPIETEEEAMGVIKYIQQQYLDYGIGRWAVIDRETNDFIGWSGLKYETEVRDYHYYDVGYRLRKEYWGKGIATESAGLALKYGFETMGLEEICAGAHVENGGSNRVLSKIGMNLTETIIYNGDPHNWYQLKKTEWEAQQ